MKSNLRNEIKSYIVRQGMTMQEVVDLLRDEHGWSDSVSNLSNKLQRESLRYVEAVQLPMRWGTRSSGRNEDKGDFSHDGYGKEAIAGAAPIGGSTGAGSGQGTKDANAQAHSGGCDSGKGASGGSSY